MRVTKAAPAAASDQPPGRVLNQVMKQGIRGRIKNLRADRYPHRHVGAFAPRAVGALAMHSAARDVQRVVTKMQQRVQRLVRLKPHIATAATFATGGTTAGNKLLAPKRRDSVATVASLHSNFGAINEHGKSKATPTALQKPAGVALI